MLWNHGEWMPLFLSSRYMEPIFLYEIRCVIKFGWFRRIEKFSISFDTSIFTFKFYSNFLSNNFILNCNLCTQIKVKNMWIINYFIIKTMGISRICIGNQVVKSFTLSSFYVMLSAASHSLVVLCIGSMYKKYDVGRLWTTAFV